MQNQPSCERCGPPYHAFETVDGAEEIDWRVLSPGLFSVAFLAPCVRANQDEPQLRADETRWPGIGPTPVGLLSGRLPSQIKVLESDSLPQIKRYCNHIMNISE